MSPGKNVIIYSDGACLGNPGPGGYAAVVIDGDSRNEYSGGFRKTTNNRMELLAAIVGLKSLGDQNPRTVVLHTDSRLLVDAFNKGWIRTWKLKNWHKSDNQPVLNRDLWEELSAVAAKHKVTFSWVKGHAGIEENERCDVLSKSEAAKPGLPPDPGYEAGGSGLFDIPMPEPKSEKVKVIRKGSLSGGGISYKLGIEPSGRRILKIIQALDGRESSIIIGEDQFDEFEDMLTDISGADHR